MPVYENYTIHLTQDNFFVQQHSGRSDEVLVIDRILGDVKLSGLGSIPETAQKTICFGVIGSIRLIASFYLILIKSRQKVGVLNGHEIWRVESVELIPYINKEEILRENEKRFNYMSKKMIEDVLKTEAFYFSYTADLTNSIQSQSLPTYDVNSSLFERANARFTWNYFLLSNFKPRREMGSFLLPIIHGFVSINATRVNNKQIEFGLVSRRSCLNAGTRFNVRGADENGNVANYVETEQFLIYQDFRCSYVQIRGSIPIFWSQKPNLKYKPSIVISETKNHLDVCQKHLNGVFTSFENQVLINLVNQHGSEGNLEKAFCETVKMIAHPNLKYEAFDFHKQCGQDRWDRLSILINRLANDQDLYGFFCVNKNGNLISSQKGVFRTNCIDCLDRTNVVQGLLAKRILHIQLIKLNIIGENEAIESNLELHEVFKKVWADNGDVMSIQYAGTGALKSDFTRTGKRTKYGLMRDGFNSMYRYYLNNFYDGYRQDSIDLFLGNYKFPIVDGAFIDLSAVDIDHDKRLLVLPILGLATFSMFLISLIIPAETLQEQFSYVLFWGFATISTLVIMLYFGKELVNSPRLVQNKFKNE